ncbi:unnamed protein product [Moneuplotes crassus]|uniref:Uncharacterized protein n=1 Tax=Euplotes crassus TaxID=5936 RepID=A0AAD1XYG7_EUPCR|nr:unnamed protein product [Moneuplotes crassus]
MSKINFLQIEDTGNASPKRNSKRSRSVFRNGLLQNKCILEEPKIRKNSDLNEPKITGPKMIKETRTPTKSTHSSKRIHYSFMSNDKHQSDAFSKLHNSAVKKKSSAFLSVYKYINKPTKMTRKSSKKLKMKVNKKKEANDHFKRYKLIKLKHNVEYVGRLNHGLSNQELLSSIFELENCKISPSSSVVKLSLKYEPPTARDYLLKMLYDKVRNKEKFLHYTKLPTKKNEIQEKKDNEKENYLKDSSLFTESVLSDDENKKNSQKVKKLLKQLEKKYKDPKMFDLAEKKGKTIAKKFILKLKKKKEINSMNKMLKHQRTQVNRNSNNTNLLATPGLEDLTTKGAIRKKIKMLKKRVTSTNDEPLCKSGTFNFTQVSNQDPSNADDKALNKSLLSIRSDIKSTTTAAKKSEGKQRINKLKVFADPIQRLKNQINSKTLDLKSQSLAIEREIVNLKEFKQVFDQYKAAIQKLSAKYSNSGNSRRAQSETPSKSIDFSQLCHKVPKYYVKIFDGTKKNQTLLDDRKKIEKNLLIKKYEMLLQHREVIMEYLNKVILMHEDLKKKQRKRLAKILYGKGLEKDLHISKGIVKQMTDDLNSINKLLQDTIPKIMEVANPSKNNCLSHSMSLEKADNTFLKKIEALEERFGSDSSHKKKKIDESFKSVINNDAIMPLVTQSLKVLGKKVYKSSLAFQKRSIMKPKFVYEKPKLPLYLQPGIVFSNYELCKDEHEAHYDSEIVNIPSFDKLN